MTPAWVIVVMTRAGEALVYECYQRVDIVKYEPGWMHVFDGKGSMTSLPSSLVKSSTVKPFGHN